MRVNRMMNRNTKAKPCSCRDCGGETSFGRAAEKRDWQHEATTQQQDWLPIGGRNRTREATAPVITHPAPWNDKNWICPIVGEFCDSHCAGSGMDC